MKLFRPVWFLLLISSLVLGQSPSGNNAKSDDNRIADQIKTLQDAIASQQQQIEALRQELANRKQAEAEPRLTNAALTTTVPTAAVAQESERPKDSPLSFRIGGTDFTPGGFVDFQNVFRTVNTGNVIGTNFGAIPFSNTAAGHLTEYRASGQYSRWNMKIGGKLGANNITGFVEGDFNGNDAANVFATTNPHTFRLRLYFADVRRGKWEITAGQAWSLITPNRVGTSPMPSDLATTYSTDANIHVGLPYSRDGQFRVTFRPNDNFSWAMAIDNPQQYTNGEVTVPTTFNAVLATQLDGAATAGVPNLFPDLMTKMAWDTKMNGRAFHIEGGGLITSAKVTAIPGGTTTFAGHSSIGSAGMGGINLELVKNFRVLAYGIYGSGIGRYFNGLGPQYVVAPIATGPGTFTIDTSMVHAGSSYGGFEATMGKTQIGAYYGGYYFQRSSFNDLTAAAIATPISCSPGAAAVNRPCIGFGGTNSANSNNRAIQEGSFVLQQTLWKNPQYGALLLINDASYSTRAPWFVAAGAPKNAHMFMDHLVIRYVIP
jgi:outer membrane murein-binding lipoprotein Lpp